MLNITFLGTGTSTGIPLIGSDHPVCKSDNSKDKRLRSSVLIEWDDLNIIVDTGPDFRQQMINCNCKRIDAVLYTHEHYDHISGIDDLRAFCFRQGSIPIYAHKRVIKTLKRRYKYIFDINKRYHGAPTLETNEISKNKVLKVFNKNIIPVSFKHGKLQVFGFKFKSLAYITDLKKISQTEIKKLKNLDILVLNCIRVEPHFSHLNLEEALELIIKIKPKKTYLTHISHLLGFHDEVESKLPENVFLSYDGLKISL